MKAKGESEEMAGYVVCEVHRTTVRRRRPRIRGPSDVYRVVKRRFEGKDREHFYVVLLNTKNEVLSLELISIGSLNASIVHPREILKPAILASAASIVLAHNHPTGDPEPSREDVEFTRRMAKCGELVGIPLIDHIVIGDGFYASLKEIGSF